MASARRVCEWSAEMKGKRLTFRLVMPDASKRGAYTIETMSTDATGAAAWRELTSFDRGTQDREPLRITPSVLAAMLDAIVTRA